MYFLFLLFETVFKHLLTDCIWYHHIGGDGLKSFSMPFILLCHLLLAGQFVWSQSLFSDKFKEYLCNGAHQEWRPSITGLIFLLTLHHLLVLPSTTHLISTFPTHIFTFFKKYLKSTKASKSTIHISTFTSPLLTPLKIILKVVQCTTSLGCTVYNLVWKSSQSLLNNSYGWRHLIFSETIWFHAMELQFTQNHISRTSRTECPFDVVIDQLKPWNSQVGESQKLPFGLDMGQF